MSTNVTQNAKHRSLRGDQLEREAREQKAQLEIAEAVAGPEPVVATDGGEDNVHASRVAQQLAIADGEGIDYPPLHVGDQVSVRDDDDGPRVPVVRVCSRTAGEYHLDFCDETVAEYNGVDDDEAVYHIKFCQRTTKDIDKPQAYPYPRSRLKLENPLHDRDEGGEE